MADLTSTMSDHGAASSLSTASSGPAGSESRPRNRRGPSTNTNPNTRNSSSRPSPAPSSAPSRAISPLPSARLSTSKLAAGGRSSLAAPSFSKGLLEGSWAPSWASVQEFTSSILTGGESAYNSDTSRPNSRNGSKSRQRPAPKATGTGRGGDGNWGPAPPAKPRRPKAEDIAAGSLAEREAALKAMKTASVLESYEGANGGLDVTGRYKRRNSDETVAGPAQDRAAEEHLVYLHHVQPNDTYAGIVLRYRCQEHAFRKANGLWSRDNIQIRKCLMIPVDTCEVKGRLCDPPTYLNKDVDHLAATPQPDSVIQSEKVERTQDQQPVHDDFFSRRNGNSQSLPEEVQPWTHVRWVKMDGFREPVEIVRVSKQAMGFFPPRRKKSVPTVSAFSSPRQSLDMLPGASGGSSEPAADSPGRLSSRRQSSMSGHGPTIGSLGTPSTGRSRVNSLGPADGAPAWMRRPGGVGTMGRSTKAPGPAKDSLNTWVNKRLPKGFNIDSMPSMSVMGSESASWGFTQPAEEGAGIVESPFEDGRDANVTNSKQGMGIEQAAATVETWLRNAWAKRPTTPIIGANKKPTDGLDLIELTDAHSDDGQPRTPLRMPNTSLMGSDYFGTTGRSDGECFVRGRTAGPSENMGKKSD